MRRFVLIGIFLMAATVHAETMYVDDTIKLGLRQEPGFNHKITETIEAGQIEILKSEKDWSYIKMPDGKEGWIANRFVTSKKPNALEVKELKRKPDKPFEQIKLLTEENKKLQAENEKLVSDAVEKQKKIKELSTSIAELKTAPKVEPKAEEPVIEFKKEAPKPETKKDDSKSEEPKKTSDMIEIIKSLEMNQIIKGSLIGVGILLVGYIMGSRSSGNRRRRSSYY